MQHKSLRGVLALALLLTAPIAQAQSGYTITDIGRGYGTSYAYGINNQGQVAGTYYTDYTQNTPDAFIYSNGVLSDLGNPGITPQSVSYVAQATAAGINNSGQIVGQYSYAPLNAGGHPVNPTTSGYIYQNGQIQAINLYDPAAINNVGQVIGEDFSGNLAIYQNGVTTPLNLPKSKDGTSVSGINNNGVIIGTTVVNNATVGLYYQNGVEHLLPLLSSSRPGAGATAINDNGQIVGGSNNFNATFGHAVLWQNGQITDLGSFGMGSSAYDINNNGVIVGVDTLAGNHDTAVVFQHGLETDLFTGSGWHDGWATSINDSGDIVGFGVSPQGFTHAFLATPNAVPEPAPLLPFGVGVGLLLLAVRRRKRACVKQKRQDSGGVGLPTGPLLLWI